jgi:DNA repair exonuclease SbcCD ATPase subunit
MIDTPTKSLLSPSIEAQQSRAKQWDEVSKLRHTTSELKSQIQEVTKEAAQEVRKRKTLQTTYDALAKHKRELSVQLELVTKSREATEETLGKLQKTLQDERNTYFKERSLWKPEIDRLTRENKNWSEQSRSLEIRCTALEENKQQLSSLIKTLETKLADALAKLNNWESSQAAFQPALDQAEKARQNAEAKSEQVQKEVEVIKRRHQKSLASLLEIQQNLKAQLQQVRQEKTATEEKLKSTQQELENVQSIAKEQEAQLAKVHESESNPSQELVRMNKMHRMGGVVFAALTQNNVFYSCRLKRNNQKAIRLSTRG